MADAAMAEMEVAAAGPAGYESLAPGANKADACASNAIREVQIRFACKVYGILAALLALTVVIAAPIHEMPKEWLQASIWLLLVSLAGVGAVASLLALLLGAAKICPLNYLLLLGFTVSQALVLGHVSTRYESGLPEASAAIAAVIFLCLTVFVRTFQLDVMGMWPYLYAGVIAASVLGLGYQLLPLMGEPKALAAMLDAGDGILLGTLCATVRVQRALGESGGHPANFAVDDFVLEAITLYFAQMFLSLAPRGEDEY